PGCSRPRDYAVSLVTQTRVREVAVTIDDVHSVDALALESRQDGGVIYAGSALSIRGNNAIGGCTVSPALSPSPYGACAVCSSTLRSLKILSEVTGMNDSSASAITRIASSKFARICATSSNLAGSLARLKGAVMTMYLLAVSSAAQIISSARLKSRSSVTRLMMGASNCSMIAQSTPSNAPAGTGRGTILTSPLK